jgi:hypothetical protein
MGLFGLVKEAVLRCHIWSYFRIGIVSASAMAGYYLSINSGTISPRGKHRW